MGGVVDSIGDALSDAGDAISDAASDVGDFLGDTVDTFQDAYDFLEDTAKDAWDSAESLAEASYTQMIESQIDFAYSAAQGDFDEAFSSIGENLTKSANAYVDFYQQAGTIMIEFNPYFRQADLLGSGSMYSTEYMKDSLNGSAALGRAAIEGDSEAILALSVMALGVYLGYTGAGAEIGTFFGSGVIETALIASFGATIYSTLESLRQIGAMSKRDYISGVRKASEIDRAVTEGYLSSKSQWMAGGMLFNSIYAGGELFNQTGSRAQARFLGNVDGNSNKRLARKLGSDHDYSRMLKAHTVGTEEFNVYMFNKK